MKTTVTPPEPSRNRWRKWNLSEERRLRTEIKADERLDEIAAKHKRTVGAITSRARYLGIRLTENQQKQSDWAREA